MFERMHEAPYELLNHPRDLLDDKCSCTEATTASSHIWEYAHGTSGWGTQGEIDFNITSLPNSPDNSRPPSSSDVDVGAGYFSSGDGVSSLQVSRLQMDQSGISTLSGNFLVSSGEDLPSRDNGVSLD